MLTASKCFRPSSFDNTRVIPGVALPWLYHKPFSHIVILFTNSFLLWIVVISEVLEESTPLRGGYLALLILIWSFFLTSFFSFSSSKHSVVCVSAATWQGCRGGGILFSVLSLCPWLIKLLSDLPKFSLLLLCPWSLQSLWPCLRRIKLTILIVKHRTPCFAK